MKFVIFLFVLKVVTSKENVAKEKIERVLVNGVVHREEVMINGIDRPYQLSYHEIENTHGILYFSYNYGRLNESTFMVGYALNGTRIPNSIEGVKNGFATAINVKDNLVYYGGSDGIYTQNLSNPKSDVTHIEKYNIWDLFYKDHLYFISYPKRRLYRFVSANNSELQRHVHEKLYQFAIDGDGDIFITNKTGLFMIKNGSPRNHRVHIKGVTVFRAVAVNKKGIAHLCGRNEIYIVDKKEHMLREIAKIKNIFGLTFDFDDNIIYSDPHQIVKLVAENVNKKSISNSIKDKADEINKV